MEHFGFVPQAFSRRASDLANEVLYSTMDSIEKVVKERLGSSENVDKVRWHEELLQRELTWDAGPLHPRDAAGESD